MCYLISKGCPWRKTKTSKIGLIIANELIREILEKYSPPEDAMNVDDSSFDPDLPPCMFCEEKSEFLRDEVCDHTTNLACKGRFQTCSSLIYHPSGNNFSNPGPRTSTINDLPMDLDFSYLLDDFFGNCNIQQQLQDNSNTFQKNQLTFSNCIPNQSGSQSTFSQDSREESLLHQYISVERIENGSKKLGPIIKYDGFTYSVQRETPRKTTWQCSHRTPSENRTKCTATIIESGHKKYRFGNPIHSCAELV